MDYVLLLAGLLSLIVCLIAPPEWIKKCKKIGLVWADKIVMMVRFVIA